MITFLRFDGIIIVRNGGSYGAVSVNWSISRNSSDSSPVSDDLSPTAGTVRFAAGQVTAVISINLIGDDQPEEAEAFLLKLLPNTVTGNAETDEPTEVSLYQAIIHVLVVSPVCSDGVLSVGRKEKRPHALVREYTLQMLCICSAHVCVCVPYRKVRWQTWHFLPNSTS